MSSDKFFANNSWSQRSFRKKRNHQRRFQDENQSPYNIWKKRFEDKLEHYESYNIDLDSQCSSPSSLSSGSDFGGKKRSIPIGNFPPCSPPAKALPHPEMFFKISPPNTEDPFSSLSGSEKVKQWIGV